MKLSQPNLPRQNTINNYFNLKKLKKKLIYISFFKKLASVKQNIYFKRKQANLNSKHAVSKVCIMFSKNLLNLTPSPTFFTTPWKLFGNTTLWSYERFIQLPKQNLTPLLKDSLKTNALCLTENLNSTLDATTWSLQHSFLFLERPLWVKKKANLLKNEYYFNLRTKRMQRTTELLQKQFKLRQVFFRQSLETRLPRTTTPYLPIPSQRPTSTLNTGIFKIFKSQQLLKQKMFYNLFSSQTHLTVLLWKYFFLSSGKLAPTTAHLYNKPLVITNLLPHTQLTVKHVLKRNQSTLNSRIQSNFLVWYNFLIVRFLENCTGYKVSIVFNPHLAKSLMVQEQAQFLLWEQRIQGFQRLIGSKISLRESLEITYLSLKLKEPSLFSNWLSRTIRKVSFWKYRAFFRFLKFLFVNLLSPIFYQLGVNGIKLRLKGKVSVAGNARTRSISYRIGRTSHSKIQNKILHELSFVYTFTGVLGLQIWYYF